MNDVATKIIACNMIHDEVSFAVRETACVYPLEWVEEGLHDSTKKLHACIQEIFDRSDAYERILLCFGTCGNMLEGLVTGDFELIVPNVDDCISLMRYPFGSGKEPGVYYTTHGWISAGGNVWDEYGQWAEKYGQENAEMILDTMIGGYHSVHLIDTGAFDFEESLALSQKAAERLSLDHHVEKGSVDWIKKLLSEDWDESFLRFGPHETVHVSNLQRSTE